MMTFQSDKNQPEDTRLKFDLEKLKHPNVLETFQAIIGRKFAPLTIINDEDADVYAFYFDLFFYEYQF